MATIVLFNEAPADPEKCTQIATRTDPARVRGRTDAAIDPDLTGLATYDANRDIDTYIVPFKYWKHVTGSGSGTVAQLSAMTRAESDAQDAQDQQDQDDQDQAGQDATRAEGTRAADGFDVEPLWRKGLIDVLVREINILRALHTLQAITLQEVMDGAAVVVDSGDVDDQVAAVPQ